MASGEDSPSKLRARRSRTVSGACGAAAAAAAAAVAAAALLALLFRKLGWRRGRAADDGTAAAAAARGASSRCIPEALARKLSSGGVLRATLSE